MLQSKESECSDLSINESLRCIQKLQEILTGKLLCLPLSQSYFLGLPWTRRHVHRHLDSSLPTVIP